MNGFRQATGELSGQVTGADPLIGLGMVSNRAGASISILNLIQVTSSVNTLYRAIEARHLISLEPQYFGDRVHCDMYGGPLLLWC